MSCRMSCSKSMFSTRIVYLRPNRSHRIARRFVSNQRPSSPPDPPPNHAWEAKIEQKARSPHAQWYSDFLPAMFPIALLGSAVYLGLQLVQAKLANEKYLDEANARIAQLEEEVRRLQSGQEARDRHLSSSSGSASSRTSDKRRSSSSRWWWFA